jgi:hypothetical protein
MRMLDGPPCPGLDTLVPVDNRTWFENDPGRDGSKR